MGHGDTNFSSFYSDITKMAVITCRLNIEIHKSQVDIFDDKIIVNQNLEMNYD